MPQLRSDYISKSISLIPEDTKNIPDDDRDVCKFCAGNESRTPAAELVLVDKYGGIVKTSDTEEERSSQWVARVFKSPRPIIYDDPEAGYSDEPLLAEPAHGSHYVVVTSPKHDDAFHSASVSQIANGLIATQEQMKTLYQGKGIAYVAAYSNYTEGKGSISHPHMELLSLSRVPPVIESEMRVTDMVFDELGICPICRMIGVETGGPRQIITTDSYIAMVPWAPKKDAEFLILPKKHQRSFLKLTQNQLKELAMIIRCSLGGFSKEIGKAYTIAFHMAPERKQQSQFHWHIEVSSFEQSYGALTTGFGVYTISRPPERIAEQLGKAARREMANVMGVK
ncbi:MAG: hypothetical protein QXR69_00885 [Conexivisphaerales archaeon]